MHTDTAQRGVVAKRRLPSDFHTPVPLIPPAARVNGTRRIRRATSVAILPSVKLYITAGKVSAALSPDKNPLAVGSLPVVRPNSNSRFFTDCYHQAAAIKPADRRKTSMRGIVPACRGRATRRAAAAQRSRSRRERASTRLSIWLLAQSLKRIPERSVRHGTAAPAIYAETTAAQLTRGISSPAGRGDQGPGAPDAWHIPTPAQVRAAWPAPA